MKLVDSLWFISLVLFYGCMNQTEKNTSGNIKDSASKAVKPVSVDDTTLTVRVDGKSHILKLEKMNVKDLLEIVKLSKEYKGAKLEDTQIDTVDVTGDGVPEIITVKTFVVKKSCYTTRTIRQDAKIIYSDTVDSGVNPFGQDPDKYDFLEPYCSLYYDLFASNIIEPDFDVQTAINEDSDMFGIFRRRKAVLKKKHLPKVEYDEQLEAFRKYLINFKGKFITHTGPDPYTMVWYEPEKRFID